MGRGRRQATAEDFWAKVDRSAGEGQCWPWTGAPKDKSRGKQGSYGAASYAGRQTGAHRIALELHLGRPLTPGLEVLHSCNNPPCCNPAHLREGTHAQNMADMVNSKRSTGATPWTKRQLEAGRRRLERWAELRHVGSTDDEGRR